MTNELDEMDVVDVEEHAAKGEPAPRARRYRIRVNGEPFVVVGPTILGRDVLELVKLSPPEEFCVRVRVRGEMARMVAPDEAVDLTARGVERFQVDERCVVTVTLNGVEFPLAVPTTGLKVKQAAIDAGASIRLDFVLYLELEDGQADPIRDDEVIFVDKGASFVAVNPDDNS